MFWKQKDQPQVAQLTIYMSQKCTPLRLNDYEKRKKRTIRPKLPFPLGVLSYLVDAPCDAPKIGNFEVERRSKKKK